MAEEESKPNPSPSSLEKLLSGANVNKTLIVLVVLFGGGNLLQTSNQGAISRSEIERAIKEVDELHATLGETVERQKAILDKLSWLTNRPEPPKTQ
jgi:hypothetical protein